MAGGCHALAKLFPLKKHEKCVAERRALFKAENNLMKANSAIFLAPEGLSEDKKDRNAKRLNGAQLEEKTRALDFKICCGKNIEQISFFLFFGRSKLQPR